MTIENKSGNRTWTYNIIGSPHSEEEEEQRAFLALSEYGVFDKNVSLIEVDFPWVHENDSTYCRAFYLRILDPCGPYWKLVVVFSSRSNDAVTTAEKRRNTFVAQIKQEK